MNSGSALHRTQALTVLNPLLLPTPSTPQADKGEIFVIKVKYADRGDWQPVPDASGCAQIVQVSTRYRSLVYVLTMNDWSEFKTAMIVAKLGSISAAASALDVHRATVSRHIDVVENTLSTSLFVRHPRGVELTEAGMEMLAVTQDVQHLFNALKGRMRNAQVGQVGELIVTSVWGVMPLVVPAVKAYSEIYPEVVVKFFCQEDNLRLEYGEAHVAVRAGPKPTASDYVIRQVEPARFSPYIDKVSLRAFESSSDLEGWRDLPSIWLSGYDRLPFAKSIQSHTSAEKAALIVDTPAAVLPAVLAGVGVGYLPRHIGGQYDQLVDLDPLNEDRLIPLWVISHRDLRKTSKVSDFVRLLIQTMENDEQER